MGKNTIIEVVKSYKSLLEKNFVVEELYIFGSAITPQFTDDSNIDVAVILDNASQDFLVTTSKLWALRREIDFRIEPILIDKNTDLFFVEDILPNSLKVI